MNKNDLTLKKARSRRYLAQSITDADYTDANIPILDKSNLHRVEQAAGGIGLDMKEAKEE